MKTRFLNSCLSIKFNALLVSVVICLFLITSCKCKRQCEGLDSKTEQLLSKAIKASLISFPLNSNWIFKRVADTTQKDTIILETQEVYPLEKGECALTDKGKCCSDYYNEKCNSKLQVRSTSGLQNFSNYYTDEEGFWMKGSWGKIIILNHIYSQDFLQRFSESLTLTTSNKILTDTKLGKLDEKSRTDSIPSLVYWSKQYGLVKYAYISGTDTIKYERAYLP